MSPPSATMPLKRFLIRSLYVFLVILFLSLMLVYNRLTYFSSTTPEVSLDKSDAYTLLDDDQSVHLQHNNLLGPGPRHTSHVEVPTRPQASYEELQSEISRLRRRLEEMEQRQQAYHSAPQEHTLARRHFFRTKQLPYSEKKRILITGGAGFVGSHLLDRLLTDGHEVIVADNFDTGRRLNIAHWIGHPNFELLHHDIVNPLYVEVDEIYHLASPASPPHYMENPVKTMKTNTIGTINMLGLAKRVRARILVASTSEVYGDPAVHPQSETYWGNVNPNGPRSCYDEGKRAAETLTYAYETKDRLDVRVARIFNTYGPRMHVTDGRVVSNFISQALQNQKLSIYGDGHQTRSFQYVSDLVEGLVRLMASNYSQPVNLGNPEEYTIQQFATIVLDLVHRNLTRSTSPDSHFSLDQYSAHLNYKASLQDDPRRRRPDISLAKNVLNWYPNISLIEGLGKTIDYFRGELRLSLGQKPEKDAPL